MIDQSIEIWDQNEMSYSMHLERCGRVCYQSDHLTKEGSDATFVKRIMNNGHTSVIEHYFVGIDIPTEDVEVIENIKENPYLRIIYRNKSRVSVVGNLRAWYDFVNVNPHAYRLHSTLCRLYPLIFKFEANNLRPYSTFELDGVNKPLTVSIITNRAIANELVRHRIMSYSQTSTRYCNFSREKFGGRLEFVKSADWGDIPEYERIQIKLAFDRIEEIYNKSDRKAQHNRDSLPLQLKTQLIMTGTIGMWKNVYCQRSSVAAHPMVRELMQLIMDKVDIS